MSGGGSSSKQSTESNPWAKAAPYLEGVLANAQTLYENAPGYAGLSEEQLSAIDNLQSIYQSGIGGTTNQAMNTWGQLMRSPEEVATSQAVRDMIATNTGNVTQQLTEGVLPQIRAGSAMAGQYGSTRQGIAEGVATGRAADAAQGYAANLTGNIYQQQLNNQLNALGYTGALQDSIVGAGQGQFDLASILQQDEDNAQNYDWNQLQNLFNFVLPAAGTGGTSTSSANQRANPFNQLLGAGLAGAGIYSGFWGG